MRRRSEGKRRILAIASAGGHWVQLLRLLPAFEGSDVAFATVYPSCREDVPGKRFYSFDDVSRAQKFRFLPVAFQLLRILWHERPDVVITTGSAPGLMAIALSKLLFRSKTIWIDSIANCEQLSSSGMRARRFADLWLTQWPHLARQNGPTFLGAVL